MATDAASVIEIRTGGDDTNGGGFVTGASGTDHTLQDAAQYSVTDAVTDGTTTITSATASFGTDVVGNWLYITGGTGSISANRYEITARGSSTSITVDRSTGLTSGTGATLKIGGALASIGELGGILNDADTGTEDIVAHIKSGTYTLTTSTLNVSGGPFSLTATKDFMISGYATTRNDYGTSPVISAGAITSINIIRVNHASFTNQISIENIKVDGNSGSSNVGFECDDQRTHVLVGCTAVNCTADGFNNKINCWGCLADSCNVGFDSDGISGIVTACVASNNTSHGFDSCARAISCLSFGNGAYGFNVGFTAVHFGCTAAGNTTVGFYNNGRGSSVVNCLSVDNGTYGFRGAVNDKLISCAAYNNTSGATSGIYAELKAISLSADPFTDSASDDYSLNNTAGGGALLRQLGLGLIGQTPLPNVGAVGFTSAVGGLLRVGMNGGMSG